MYVGVLPSKDAGSNLELCRNISNPTYFGRTRNNQYLEVTKYVILLVSLLMFSLLVYQLGDVNEIGRSDIVRHDLQDDEVGARGNTSLMKRRGFFEFASGAGIHIIGTVSEAAGAIGAASCVATAVQGFHPAATTLCAASLSVYVVFQAIYRQLTR